MRHNETGSTPNSRNAARVGLWASISLPSRDRTTHTPDLSITTIPLKGALTDLIVSTKGRTPEPVTVIFENATNRQSRHIKHLLTTSASGPSCSLDPVRSVSLICEAIDYAQFRGVRVTTPSGKIFHNELSAFFDREIATYSPKQLKSILRIEGLGCGIYHVSYPNLFMMSASFMRLQEHFESPRFRGKIFTAQEFREWYPTTREHGEFSYYSDWSGYNVPGDTLRLFCEGDFDPLTPLERLLVDTFSDLKGPLYLIGTTRENSLSTLRHEIAHALYHTNEPYRMRVDRVLAPLNLTPIYRVLKALGYHRQRWEDEAHAYLGDPLDELTSHGINPRMYEREHHELLKIYNEYSPVKAGGRH